MRAFLTPLLVGAVWACSSLPASAHLPFDMPGPAPTLEQAVVLPDSQATWSIYGLLAAPGQVDFIRLDNVDNELDIALIMRTFTRPVYTNFAPSFAFIARGLPQPSEPLPFTLPAGYGTEVKHFTGDSAERPLSGTGSRIVWVGQLLNLPDITESPAYVAVWHPTGQTGEYNLSYDIVPDTHHPELAEIYKHPVTGDGNEDGNKDSEGKEGPPDITDALITLQLAVGALQTTPRLLRALDVFPPKVDRSMQGDGVLSIDDALRILRRAVGLEEDPFP